MNEQNSTETARIRALKTSLVSLLEHDEDDENIPAAAIRQGATFMIEAFQQLLNDGSKQLVRVSSQNFHDTLRSVQSAYGDWRDVDAAFGNILELAYNGYIPRNNLLLDEIHTQLQRRVGEPVSALYSSLHATWSEHLEASPWDEHMAGHIRDANTPRLNASLKSLVHGDHLDVEDAVQTLTGPLRHAFAGYLERRTDTLDLLEDSLWMRPEIVVMNDYWTYQPKVRILDILGRNATKHSAGFARVHDLFNDDSPVHHRDPRHVVAMVAKLRPEQREVYYRCLLLHPDQLVRRFAVNNVNLESLWNVVTPETVPCATLLSLAQRISGDPGDENTQKIFFEAIHRRLLSLTSRSDIIYARGIVRMLARLPFFMQDYYFEQLLTVIDYLTEKERIYRLDSILDEYIDQLKREKDGIGNLDTQVPNLRSTPPVVLRKLARDGHFWYELSMHPIFKIARETIPHINSEGRAVRMANNHQVSQDVIRAVGRNRSLFHTMPAKVALLSNPKTPPAVSTSYLMDLTPRDCDALLRRSTVHPEFRQHLRRRLAR